MGKIRTRLLLPFLVVLTGALVARAQIPLARHPPQLALHQPPVYPVEFADAGARTAFSIGVFCDATGQIDSLDTRGIPPEVAPAIEASLKASVFRPAHDGHAHTLGYRRVLLRAYFTPVRGAPTPSPRFQLDQAARDKLDTIGRTIVRGWLRIRLIVDADGDIRRVETQNRGLDEALETFFRIDVDQSQPLFEPARDGGRNVSGEIDLFWDLTPPQDREDFVEIEPELVQMGENSLDPAGDWPSEDTSFRGWVFPHSSNRVTAAYVEASAPPPLARAFVERAGGWFIPERNVDTPLEVILGYDAEVPALIVHSFRPVTVSGPSLRFSSRPIYPRRRFLPDPVGFVRVQFTVDIEGRPTDVMILEASSGRFRAPALEAIETWHFSPMMVDGEPVPARVFWTVPFDPEAKP